MTATGLVAGVVFTWLGMVLAISFLEAPLKFQAPDVTLRIGLGIGRIVFRALNAVEAALALVLVVTAVLGTMPASVLTGILVAVAVLALQLFAVRPALNRRSDRVLAGEIVPRSRAHVGYVVAEAVKVVVLLLTGVLALLSL